MAENLEMFVVIDVSIFTFPRKGVFAFSSINRSICIAAFKYSQSLSQINPDGVIRRGLVSP